MKLLLFALFLISNIKADECREVCYSDNCVGTDDNAILTGEQWITTQETSSYFGCCSWGLSACNLCCPPPPEPEPASKVQHVTSLILAFQMTTVDEARAHEVSLKRAMAMALNIDEGNVDLKLDQDGESVHLTFTLQGDYAAVVNDQGFVTTYVTILQGVDQAAFDLSQRQPGRQEETVTEVTITFHNTQISVLETYRVSLKSVMAEALGVSEADILEVALELKGSDVVIRYKVKGDHTAKVHLDDFGTTYYTILKGKDANLYALSQGTHSSQMTKISIDFYMTSISVIQDHVDSLTEAMGLALKINSDEIEVVLRQDGKDVIASFTIAGDYESKVNASGFTKGYLNKLQIVDVQAYALSQGTHSSQDPCLNVDCKHGGTCAASEGGYVCNCVNGYGGKHCGKSSISKCSSDAYYAIKKTCRCNGKSCSEGMFCHAGGCTTSAACNVRDSVDSEFFYGAKLEGHWDPENRDMYLDLPVPGDVMVSKIKWIDAQSQMLGFGGIASMWTKDTTDQCKTHFKLKVNCDDFFGKGSRFTLTGKQMKTELRVDASEKVVQTIDGFAYTRNREMSNIVPLVVNLIERTTVRAHFRTVFSTQKKVELHVPYISISSEKDKFITETNTYLHEFGVTVVDITSKSSGPPSSQGNLEIELTGEPGDVQRSISFLKIHGFVTKDFGPYTVERRVEEHHEFVLFISAREKNNGAIEIEMEVHTRTGVDHSKKDGGCRVTSKGKEKIKNKGISFDWEMDGTNYVVTEEHKLKVEKVKWTFTPKKKVEGPYEIPIEFDLNGKLGSFVSFATVNIKTADVLGDIGFGAIATLYEDKTATKAQSSFKLGQTFYVKITLDKVCVDVASINCERMTLTQTKENGDNIVTNMKDADFNPMEELLDSKSVMCGATLVEETERFHARADGYHTDLEIVVKVTYKQGKQADMLTLRRRLSFENEVRNADDSEVIALEMEILPQSLETAIGFAQTLTGATNFHKGSLIALTLLSSGVFLIYNFMNGKKSGEYHPLIEV